MILAVSYTTLSFCIAFLNLWISHRALKTGSMEGRYLALSSAFAALVNLSYLCSVFCSNEFVFSVFSSIYFISIDIMLIWLVFFAAVSTHQRIGKVHRSVLYALLAWMGEDILVCLINPFTRIMIGFSFRDTFISKFAYQILPLYTLHLIYTYLLVGVILFLFLKKAVHIAKEYRNPFRFCVLVILLLVAVNAVFLYIPDVDILSLLDVSILGYGIAASALYWSQFVYTRTGMVNILKSSIFDTHTDGIVLFDYNNAMILFNQKASQLLSEVELSEGKELEAFLDEISFGNNTLLPDGTHTMQLYQCGPHGQIPIRCQYGSLKNKKKQHLGWLFTFTDISSDYDWLTGFMNWDSFLSLENEEPEAIPCPFVVANCDITALSVINSTLGRAKGDQLQKELSNLLRHYFPEGCMYIRTDAGHLIVVTPKPEAEVICCLEELRSKIDRHIQYSTSVVNDQSNGIIFAIERTEQAIQTKKLLDQKSQHSAIVTSLMAVLKECDNATEAHVKRTQILGKALGERLGLSDLQRSQLALLCMMHDIGKIGIPLEILKKPGRLSEEEWTAIRSHSEKGAEIAASVNELVGISEMILHHHESWDGTGYPSGISRETIPLLSRIISVVDAYDAMVNDRPYRQRMSPQEAFAELKRFAGTQFDPSIVSEFIHLLEDVPSLCNIDTNELTENNSILTSLVTNDYDYGFLSPVHDVVTENQNVFPMKFCQFIIDGNMYLLECDQHFTELTGYTNKDLSKLHLRLEDLIPENCRKEYLNKLNTELSQNNFICIEHRIKTKVGIEIAVLCMGKLHYDAAFSDYRGEFYIVKSSDTHLAHLIMAQEQSKAMQRLQQWEKIYRKDSLTGLLCHSPFKNDVEQHILNNESRTMLLMIDIDNFKDYNDTYGHQAGDELLIMVAHSLDDSLGKADLPCRMGGDEFAAAAFFPLDTPDEVIFSYAQNIFDRMIVILQSLKHPMSISMGCAIQSNELDSFAKLYRQADRLLYQSKNSGRGKLTYK